MAPNHGNNDQRTQEALTAFIYSRNLDEAIHILHEHKDVLLFRNVAIALKMTIMVGKREGLFKPLTIDATDRRLRLLQNAIKHGIPTAREIEESISEREFEVVRAYLSIPLANERLLLLIEDRKGGILPTEKTISKAINDLRPIVKKHKNILLNVKMITDMRRWIDENPDQRSPEVTEAKQRFLEEASEKDINYAWKQYLEAAILEIRHMFRDMPRYMWEP